MQQPSSTALEEPKPVRLLAPNIGSALAREYGFNSMAEMVKAKRLRALSDWIEPPKH